MEEVNWEAIQDAFQRIWGYDDFRYPQREVIEALMQRRDSLVILATGSGKSICFQLPALLQEGLTVAISPLLSLMADQVQDLQARGLPVAMLNSTLSTPERRQVLQNLSKLRLLYVSPETLLSQPVWKRLCEPEIEIAGLMLDEAHCLVQWGDSFRPAYRRLGAVRAALLRQKSPDRSNIAVAAFTATADPHTQQELQACLQLQNPQIIRTSPYRPNLSLNVAIAWTVAGRKRQCLKFIEAHRDEPGIIYMRSRRETEALATWLQSQSLHGQSLYTTAYHAGLPTEERRRIEQEWLVGKYQFIVCTSAFGLGINNPKTRWVLHYQAPLTLAEYIQEVGRAGRDGKPAQALMLVSEPTGWLDASDRDRQSFFVQQQQNLQRRAQSLISKLPNRGNYETVTHTHTDAAIALGLLHSAGKLTWHSPFDYELHGDKQIQIEFDEAPLEEMQAYIRTRTCRWAFLMQAFGFDREARNLRCGACDRCCARK
ncbi:RecQ family ATP-dependent DNA helicase [Pseudanabaena sp. PCC 6802]|uniref:RecQ family ATP-dependent DNA helicase n=1 Tax=Pseudanabaena sp. PCC 6802 TaxID=118173 RepID=UPI00034675E2|nr:RecQ family ATP-dependent DNA helicase [Pseudanabaena sp. PCC 6802]